jgi:hypothetical protein
MCINLAAPMLGGLFHPDYVAEYFELVSPGDQVKGLTIVPVHHKVTGSVNVITVTFDILRYRPGVFRHPDAADTSILVFLFKVGVFLLGKNS